MAFAVERNPRAIKVNVTADELVVRLADGRIATVSRVGSVSVSCLRRRT